MAIKGLISRVTATLHSQKSGAVASESPQEFHAQVERVANSSLFYGSEALPKLLRYLASYSLSVPIGHLKEYQIATEVLGRSSNFDPQSDACVRVQVGRLRGKLAEYYETVGAQDEMLLQIPKGGYSLVFEKRVKNSVQPHLTAVGPVAQTSPFRQTRFLAVLAVAVAASSLITAALLIYFLPERDHAHAAGRPGAPTAAISTFWSPFFTNSDGPYVVYSAAAFAYNPIGGGMRYYDPKRDRPNQVNHHYTGTGELEGAVHLALLFQQFDHPIRLKRSALFSVDDARQNNLVFLGSRIENAQLNKILTTQEFDFGDLQVGTNSHWFGVNVLHPRPGEPKAFVPDAFPEGANYLDARPGGSDYAIIALAKGVDPSHRILILAGASTLATQAAVDFVCDPASIADLERRLGSVNSPSQPTFEAVIQVKIADDVPLESHLVALRRTQ
jgi:hypothetical protein